MTRLVACSMMKDEEDVAYSVIRHLASEGVEHIVVADNLSTDNTAHELRRARQEVADTCAVTIVTDGEHGYYQSKKMTNLAKMAADGYDNPWVIPFDADELWLGKHSIKKMLDDSFANFRLIEVPMWNHYCTSLDGETGNPFKDMAWKHPDRGALPKVMFRWSPDVIVNQGNHSVTFTEGIDKHAVWDFARAGKLVDELQIRHFPYRSWEHFKRKAVNGAAAYKATDLPYDQGAHWRQYGELLERHGEQTLYDDVWLKYFHFVAPVNEGLTRDPAPLMRFV